jgi:hypothetical protein
MICAWIETSRADTGSSATRKRGSPRNHDTLALAAREVARTAAREIDGKRVGDFLADGELALLLPPMR